MFDRGATRLNRRRTISVSRDSLAVASLTDSRLATLCAETARDEFLKYETGFDTITKRARDRFAQSDWKGSHTDAAERLHLYSRVLDELVSEIRRLMGERLRERSVWVAMKAVYSSLIAESLRWEIAESFFNSLTRRIFATEGVDQSIEFVDTDFDAPPARPAMPVWKRFSGRNLTELLFVALTDKKIGGFEEERWQNLRDDIELAAERLRPALSAKQTDIGTRFG